MPSGLIVYELSDHFDGERFFNPTGTSAKGLKDVLKWLREGGRAAWPPWIEHGDPQPVRELEKHAITATFVNHATVLLRIGGLNILTDPIWSERASPTQWAGPKRVHAPGIAFDDLPPIHLVVVSHNHYDHMDQLTLKRLAKAFNPRFLVALGDKRRLEGWGIRRVHEMDWWQEITLNDVRVVFLPTQHWSSRGPHDRNRSLWGSFAFLTRDHKVYFGGDAGYSRFYQDIRQRIGPMDLSLLPIGAYEPRWFMKEHHMNPAESLQAHRDLESAQSIGIHFGTFQLTNEGIDEPVKALQQALRDRGLSPAEFRVLKPGESWIPSEQKAAAWR